MWFLKLVCYRDYLGKRWRNSKIRECQPILENYRHWLLSCSFSFINLVIKWLLFMSSLLYHNYLLPYLRIFIYSFLFLHFALEFVRRPYRIFANKLCRCRSICLWFMILISKYKPNYSTTHHLPTSCQTIFCQWREQYCKTDSSLSLHVSAYKKGSILYKLWQSTSLVVCSALFAKYIYLWVFYAIIGLYRLNITVLRADKE